MNASKEMVYILLLLFLYSDVRNIIIYYNDLFIVI